MTEDDYKRILMKQLSPQKVKEFNTTILIGRSARIAKKMLPNGYRTITTADDVRSFLDYYSTPTDAPIIFEDPSRMVPSVQAYLLKFIEEPPAPLIILASKDNISPVLLSRCKRCIKFPEDIKHGTKTLQEFTEAKMRAEEEYRTLLKEKQDIPDDVYKYMTRIEKTSLEECPEYLYIRSGVTINISHLDKFIGLL